MTRTKVAWLNRFADQYWDALRALLDRLVQEQQAAIDAAADVIVQRALAGGRVFLYDTGHLLEREFINRAGGFVGWAPLSFQLAVTATVAGEPAVTVPDPPDAALAGFVQYALDAARVQPGDVLILGSVTGARKVPVELARQARPRGVAVIAITSLTYSRTVPAQHPSGQKLYDIADVVLNNDTVVGDALVAVPGLPDRVGPSSGITAATLAWMLAVEVAGRLSAQGQPPLILESMNLPGAPARNAEKARQYVEQRRRALGVP